VSDFIESIGKIENKTELEEERKEDLLMELKHVLKKFSSEEFFQESSSKLQKLV